MNDAVNTLHINEEAKARRRYRSFLLVMFAVMVCAAFFSFWVGYYPLEPMDVIKAFAHRFGYRGNVLPQAVTIFWRIRLPRMLSALFIGASLSVAGSAYQGMFRNPLVSPDILGVSAGASLGASLAIYRGLAGWGIQVSAFAGGITAVSLSYLISRKSALSQILSLVLTGSMIMALCNAGVTMIKYVADPNDVLQQITFWLMGSLTKTNMESFSRSAAPMLAGLVTIWVLRWRINLLTLDEEEAKSLGVNIRRYRLIFIVASTVLSAAAVCLGGLIGWVGLMVPHICRVLVGPDYKRLVPACAMVGAAFLVLMDDLARSLFSLELPLGVVTSVMGAPFFIYLIIKRRER
jgi:iron complex transport system permease protein